MRAAIVVTVAVMLAVGSTVALGQTQSHSQPAPLSAGQPAGLQQAQRASNTLPILLGVGAVAAGIALVASGNNDDSNPVVPTTTTAP